MLDVRVQCTEILLIHYHLRPGGVRRVIEAQAQVLEQAGVSFLVLTGEAPADEFAYRFEVVSNLGYGLEAPDLRRFLGRQAVWHFHNPSLGKNPGWSSVIDQLIRQGERVLLQIHDLAEDGRPENYQALSQDLSILYPTAPNVHYAFINSRDYLRFLAGGLPGHYAKLIGNPVSLPPHATQLSDTDDGPSVASGPCLVFFPIRGIRRKNLGEALFWASLAKHLLGWQLSAGESRELSPPRGGLFAVGLAAGAGDGEKVHSYWQMVARKLQLPILFNVVDRLAPPILNKHQANSCTDSVTYDFSAWLNATTNVMTTSIAEGFGLGFLEPSLLNLPLMGRDLPDITRDFSSPERPLGALYTRLLVPIEGLLGNQVAGFEPRLEKALASYYRAYGVSMNDIGAAIDAFYFKIASVRYVDFGRLPEDLQALLLVRFESGPELYSQCVVLPSSQQSNLSSSPGLPPQVWFEHALGCRHSMLSAEAVDQQFGLPSYGKMLLSYYRKLADCPCSPIIPRYLKPEKILAQYLDAGQFAFIRS